MHGPGGSRSFADDERELDRRCTGVECNGMEAAMGRGDARSGVRRVGEAAPHHSCDGGDGQVLTGRRFMPEGDR